MIPVPLLILFCFRYLHELDAETNESHNLSDNITAVSKSIVENLD